MKEKKDYTYRSMRDEREYGLYWYSGLWHVLRPVLVGLTVLVLVVGIGMTVWDKLYGSFVAPVDRTDTQEYSFEISSGESLNRVATNLEDAGLIRSRSLFKYYCDFAGMSQNPVLILMMKYDLAQSLRCVALSAAWIVALELLAKLLFSHAVRKVTVQGG